MVIISKRSPRTLEYANEAAAYAPNVWAHQRTMLAWSRMNVIDQETFRNMHSDFKELGYKWIASWPLAVAGAINKETPDVFNDVTGRTMLRYLQSEAGHPYRAY